MRDIDQDDTDECFGDVENLWVDLLMRDIDQEIKRLKQKLNGASKPQQKEINKQIERLRRRL